MKNYLTITSARELFTHFLSTGIALFLFSSNLFAASANIAWDASTSSNVGGYKVSYGQSSGNYTSTIDAGNTTTYAVTGLQAGSKYYFAAKAYDSTRTTESAYSNEVNMTVPATTALTADFTASATQGVQGISVTFTPVTTGTVTSWQWNFAGSYTPSVTNSTAQTVKVTYPNAGTYSVSLTIAGPGGSITKTYPNLITVTAPPPVATTPPPVGTPSPVTGAAKGLVAAYGFEEINGTTVTDTSGNSNHGTITNAVSIANGHSGNALQFNGTNAWVTVNDNATLALSTGMTLEAWVYPTSVSTGGKTVILKEGSGTEVYSLYAKEDTALPVSYVNNGSYSSVAGSNQLPVNQWSHLVATYDGQYQRIYVGGKEVGNSQQSGLIQPSTGVLRIGGNSLWGEYFQGYIDEVRIYNRALTATEVNYNLATAISISNPPQLILGTKTLEPLVDYSPQGLAEAFQTTPQKSGLVTTVQVYLDADSTATELVAGIYKNNNGHPGALVAQGKLSTLKSGAWNSVALPVTSVTAGQPYWVAILGSKGQIAFLDQQGSGLGLNETSASNTLTTLPDLWVTGSVYHDGQMSFYGTGY